ncbi:hypothetical protein CLOSTASPAR_03273 [[Clostridium] asparagiforme DSM 15981]|uniref:Uncharacterized protein n=1 Tax=[Clostridium] asparagiforme DSM 15981 TaxID=518636 RepID=C0D1Y4_9FIRM|nr:hypothetical protein CLOSTASPAR_03273 [[Clostridium] asparagiforme DSM 15981]
MWLRIRDPDPDEFQNNRPPAAPAGLINSVRRMMREMPLSKKASPVFFRVLRINLPFF